MWNKIQQMSRQSRLATILLILISLPFDLNIIWSFTSAGWLYWGARFLGAFEQITAGALLVFFPNALQRRLKTKVNNRVAILLIIFGIYLLYIGIDLLFLMARRWTMECTNIMECLKYY
jgi:uncharacterized iron-regulated membrane protein